MFLPDWEDVLTETLSDRVHDPEPNENSSAEYYPALKLSIRVYKVFFKKKCEFFKRNMSESIEG